MTCPKILLERLIAHLGCAQDSAHCTKQPIRSHFGRWSRPIRLLRSPGPLLSLTTSNNRSSTSAVCRRVLLNSHNLIVFISVIYYRCCLSYLLRHAWKKRKKVLQAFQKRDFAEIFLRSKCFSG